MLTLISKDSLRLCNIPLATYLCLGNWCGEIKGDGTKSNPSWKTDNFILTPEMTYKSDTFFFCVHRHWDNIYCTDFISAS